MVVSPQHIDSVPFGSGSWTLTLPGADTIADRYF